jgi:transposase
MQRGVVRVLSNGKRIYAEEFKTDLVRQCLVPGASVAATGMAHGINANLLRRWIVLHGARGHASACAPALLPVTLSAQSLAHVVDDNYLGRSVKIVDTIHACALALVRAVGAAAAH